MRKTPEKVSFFCVEKKGSKRAALRQKRANHVLTCKHNKKAHHEKTSKESSVHPPVRRKGCFRKSFMGSIGDPSTRGTPSKKTTLEPRDVARQSERHLKRCLFFCVERKAQKSYASAEASQQRKPF
ncbi:hypothetical protein ABD70_06545 [Alkalihalobacillus lehensis]|nr:hypothetical protein [Shouchella lehensis]